MGIDTNHLRLYVVRPVLLHLDLHSAAAENLILGTAAQESLMGTYLRQIRGPALGIYQMEPFTHDDLWYTFLQGMRPIIRKIRSYMAGDDHEASQLVWNLKYATAMTRIYYYRVFERLPHEEDVQGMARYWKKYYNTPLGKGKEEEFIKRYNEYVQARTVQ